MRTWVIISCFVLLACNSKPEKAVDTDTPAETVAVVTDTEVVETDTDTSLALDSEIKAAPAVYATKNPSGIYQFIMPYQGTKKILHTIAFYEGTYRLQEEYLDRNDSVSITEGTWAPSTGYIWLYKDQIVRGRYTWKGDTLQYYSPQLKKTFSMTKPDRATVNPVWQTKRGQGTYLYGVGNEPFWSVELTNSDSIVLNRPEWTQPLRAKLTTTSLARDSSIYTSMNDSLQVIVFPVFCSDGMSDFLYTQKVKVIYKGQTYQGCGEILQPSL